MFSLKKDRANMILDKDMRYKIIRQEAKCLALQGKYYDAVHLLGRETSERIRFAASGFHRDNKNEDEEVSRALLNLVSWLEADWTNLGPYLEALHTGGSLNVLCQSLEEIVRAEHKIKDRTLIKTSLLDEAHHEAVLGCLVNLASIKAEATKISRSLILIFSTAILMKIMIFRTVLLS